MELLASLIEDDDVDNRNQNEMEKDINKVVDAIQLLNNLRR